MRLLSCRHVGVAVMLLLGLASRSASGQYPDPAFQPAGSPDVAFRLPEPEPLEPAALASVYVDRAVRTVDYDYFAGAAGPPEPLPPTPEERIHDLQRQIDELRAHPAAPPQPAIKFPTAKLTGFMHLDAGNFSQSPLNMATLGDIQDGVEIRRARLQAVGSVAEFTNYSIEMDFAQAGRPSFQDVWGEQTHLPYLGNVRLGQYRQPFSMDSITPIRQLWFLERSLPFQAFDPFRRVGVMAYDKSESELTAWAFSVFRTGGFNNGPLGDSRVGTDIGDEGGVSVMGKVTHLLWYDEPAEGRYLLHVGGAYDYGRNTGSNTNAPYYQARAIPEFFMGDPAGGGLTAAGTPFFVDTGRLASEQFQIFNLQLAGQYGPAHFQAEYIGTLVDQTNNPDVYYDGAYLQVGYFLTGEHYSYNKTFGVFDKVTPYSEFFSLGRDSYVCGWGAWETTARVSYVNLNDPDAVPILFTAGPPPSPNPGRLTDITVGLNWYWNAYAKLQFNYIHCFLDNAALGDSDCNIFAGRFQIAF